MGPAGDSKISMFYLGLTSSEFGRGPRHQQAVTWLVRRDAI